jgi:SAM-dependent methyltransferase
LTPELLQRAEENAQTVRVDIEWHEGDVEALPYKDGTFDVVLSQFGHIFAPRAEVAIAEMLRVLRRGGTIAFSTWPPELLVGRMMAIVGGYMPPPPAGVVPPTTWGDPNIVRERLGSAVRDLTFDRGRMLVAALSPAHFRVSFERTVGPVRRVVESLEASDPVRLEAFRREYTAAVAEYFEDNVVRQEYLLTRAIKI